MKVKLTRNTFVTGELVEAGRTGNLPDELARQLIAAGKAIAVSIDDDDDDDDETDDESKAKTDRQKTGADATKR